MTVAERSAIVRGTRSAERIRVLIVDDSLVIRHLVREALSREDAIEVVGMQADGVAALECIAELRPDVVILDVEMPKMNGLETLVQLRRKHPHLRTIMFSTITTRGASTTLQALSLGADDYVAKASNCGSLDKSLASLRAELIPRIKQFFSVPTAPSRAVSLAPKTRPPARSNALKPEVVVIGVSTGGPTALARVIPKLPPYFPLPVVIVQHMPPMFTRLLAEQLDSQSGLRVAEAEEGSELLPGLVLVAPGNRHLTFRRSSSGVFAQLDQNPHVNSCRPSVDVLYQSAAEVFGARTLAVTLTGMGSDGLKGARALKQIGAACWAQDQASSVVWGMPGAVANAGLADLVLPLERISEEIVRYS